MNNRLLIDESPLQVLPTLAVEIGLNEAMFLQQLHFWLGVARRGRTGRRHEGKVWSYKTFEEWQQENFPFWSVSTIKRLVDKLVKSGLILAEKLDSHKRIQTNFYTINYAALKQICDGLEDEKCSVSECDDGECQNDTMEQLKMTRPIVSECDDVYVSTENTTETTTETTTEITCDSTSRSKYSEAFNRFWLAYPNTSRRVAKGKCFDIWKRKNLETIADEVVEHVKAMAKTKQWREGYEPAPLTYLNQDRWEDGLPDPQRTKVSPSGGSALYDQNMAAAEEAKRMLFGDGNATV